LRAVETAYASKALNRAPKTAVTAERMTERKKADTICG
jgi:hypothetical protein